MIVYRFEKNGIGPFISNDGVRRGVNEKHSKRAKRVLHANGERGISMKLREHSEAVSNGMYFGMPSKESLKAYFGYELKHMFKKGFRIVKYEIPQGAYIRCGAEIAFDIKQARRFK